MKKRFISIIALLILAGCTAQRTCPQAYPKKKSQLVINNKF